MRTGSATLHGTARFGKYYFFISEAGGEEGGDGEQQQGRAGRGTQGAGQIPGHDRQGEAGVQHSGK